MSLANNTAKLSNGFCVSPHTEVHIDLFGEIGFCCQHKKGLFGNIRDVTAIDAFNSKLYAQSRKDTLNNKWATGCGNCIESEKDSEWSHRFSQQVEFDNSNFNTDSIDKFSIDFSNACNLRCTMCSPLRSTGWYKDATELKKQLKISSHFVLVAGSTRAGEEKILLNLVKKLNYKELILVIVPRHPERFSEVEKIFQSQSLKIVKKSDLGGVKKTPQYVLGDTMGELYELYGLATLAVIGGSILDYGGQNPIEPMSLSVQTAVGPSIYNFKDMVNTAEKNNAIFRFKNIAELEVIIKNLVDKGQVNQGVIKNAQKYIKQSSGGTDKVVQLINQYL